MFETLEDVRTHMTKKERTRANRKVSPLFLITFLNRVSGKKGEKSPFSAIGVDP